VRTYSTLTLCLLRAITAVGLVTCCTLMNYALAAPNLQDVRVQPGLIIISDHQKRDVFYYLFTGKQLLKKNDAPVFIYHLNRYLGHQQTGNRDEFWVRGVIKFSTTAATEQGSFQKARQNLITQNKRTIKLLAAPVHDSYNRLIYATVESDGIEGTNGELEGGFVSEQNSENPAAKDTQGTLYGSRVQRYTIGLTAHDAELFWEKFHDNSLILSLAYGWSVKGMIRDLNNQWVESEYAFGDTLSIDVSPSEYPDLFSRNELWQRLRYAHSNVLVMCYDFINAENTDLYYVAVELRFPTTRNQFYKESVKFTADSDSYEKSLSFKLANDIKQGYEYRVRRLTTEGELIQSDWMTSSNAFLDVSASASVLADLNKPELEEDEL